MKIQKMKKLAMILILCTSLSLNVFQFIRTKRIEQIHSKRFEQTMRNTEETTFGILKDVILIRKSVYSNCMERLNNQKSETVSTEDIHDMISVMTLYNFQVIAVKTTSSMPLEVAELFEKFYATDILLRDYSSELTESQISELVSCYSEICTLLGNSQTGEQDSLSECMNSDTICDSVCIEIVRKLNNQLENIAAILS